MSAMFRDCGAEDADECIPCSAGGVKLVSGTDRITLDNTLDERLRLLEDRVRVPGVRKCPPLLNVTLLPSDASRDQDGFVR